MNWFTRTNRAMRGRAHSVYLSQLCLVGSEVAHAIQGEVKNSDTVFAWEKSGLLTEQLHYFYNSWANTAENAVKFYLLFPNLHSLWNIVCLFAHWLGSSLASLGFRQSLFLFCGYLSSLLCPPFLRCPWSSQHPCSTQPLPFPLTVVSGSEICSHTLELCCSLLALSHQTCLPCQTAIVVLENLHLQKNIEAWELH